MRKKICFVTGSRADYGLLYPLLKKIRGEGEKEFDLKIIATGMHLSREFGSTYKSIKRDGFKIDAKVKMHIFGDSAVDITKSTGQGMVGFADVFNKIKPDMVVLLGDRFEILSSAVAAFFARIPVAHIHGGEMTIGALDDAMRHAITKFSQLHFTSTEVYRRRVIQLGESPKRVFNTGALGIDNIKKMKLLNKSELEKELGIKIKGKTALVTFHPVTLEDKTAGPQFKELLAALSELKELKVIFTKPNADIGGKIIIRLIDDYIKNNPGKAVGFISLGQLRYLSLIRFVNVVVGNSSSGIIEVPSFNKPTVNIGDRQKGRIKADSVIDCQPRKEDILRALKRTFSPEFRSFCKTVKNVYGNGNAAGRIYKVLKSKNRNLWDIKKTFYDVRMPNGL